jgi:hypothetical protein
MLAELNAIASSLQLERALSAMMVQKTTDILAKVSQSSQ